MQMHQQIENRAGKLHIKVFSLIVVLIMLLGMMITLARIVPAKADISTYKYADMPCVWSPYAKTGPRAQRWEDAWCKNVDKKGNIISYDDWGTIRDKNSPKSIISPYGYAYRNCTDYVAWKVSTLGVQQQQYLNLGDAKNWANAPAANHLNVDEIPAVGSAAVKTSGQYGHVAFVESVHADGTITVSEFNEYFDGSYDTRTGTPAKLGFSKFVHFEKYETGKSPTPTSPTPIPSAANSSVLSEIAAVSANDMWAVGNYYANTSKKYQTLIEQWKGSTWNVVSSPNPGGPYKNAGLSSIAAVSATNVWAVGSYLDSNSISHTLIEHWNGSSWHIIPAQDGSTFGSSLSAIAVVSATDIWAVGYYLDSSKTDHTLIEKWNGASWNIIPSPNGNTAGSGLNAIAAISATNIWAVGDSASNNGPANSLIEHWNGTRWSVVANPNKAGANANRFTSIVAISSKDIWAAGSTFYSSGNVHEATLIEHWDGTRWKIISSPNRTGDYNSMDGMTAISSKDIWTVGATYFNNNTSQTLMENWNGTSWSIIPSSNPSSPGLLYLTGIADISNTNIWAVGYYDDRSANTHSLIEHWDGKQWKIVSGKG